MSMTTVTIKAADPFASEKQSLFIPSVLLGQTLSFLGPKDLTNAEKVCHVWLKCIQMTLQWKNQSQNSFHISTEIAGLSYKQSIELIFPRLLGRDVWRTYIGEVGPVPRIPEAISPNKWFEPDPCDSSTTIGKEYVWMYCPSHIEINLEGFSLSEPDDPASEAPKLIEKAGDRVKKVPVTINNIEKLFNHPKAGYASKYGYIWENIVEQHGNKKIQEGWVCMRMNPVGRNLSFQDQQTFAAQWRVEIVQLAQRIIFNLLQHVRSNIYADGYGTFTRTSTLTFSHNQAWPSGCGRSESSLIVGDDTMVAPEVGLGVALRTEAPT